MSAVVSYQPQSFGELETFCKRICATAMVPPSFRGKPEEAAVAIIYGSEIGLPPMTSLQMVAVINGRPGVYGDALPGLAMNKGLIRDMREHFEGEPFRDDFTAVCEVVRPNGSAVVQRFSVGDAKRAGLWDKAGPWKQYPKRMLQWRARGFAIRDAAPHGLFGNTAEELQDIDVAEQPRGPDTARDITPEQTAPGPRAEAAAAMVEAETVEPLPEEEDPADPIRIADLKGKEAFQALEWAIERADAAEADRLMEVYRSRIEKLPPDLRKALSQIVVNKITAIGGQDDGQGALV